MSDVPGDDKARIAMLVCGSPNRRHAWVKTGGHQELKQRKRKPNGSTRGRTSCPDLASGGRVKAMLLLCKVFWCAKLPAVS